MPSVLKTLENWGRCPPCAAWALHNLLQQHGRVLLVSFSVSCGWFVGPRALHAAHRNVSVLIVSSGSNCGTCCNGGQLQLNISLVKPVISPRYSYIGYSFRFDAEEAVLITFSGIKMLSAESWRRGRFWNSVVEHFWKISYMRLNSSEWRIVLCFGFYSKQGSVVWL
jgi:hypothetical protein